MSGMGWFPAIQIFTINDWVDNACLVTSNIRSH